MSEKTKKPQKLKARLPRGFVDREAHDIRAVNEMTAKIREVYERYGFDPVETPLFEYTDALGKFLPDSDRPNEGVFSLQDDDDQWMSLRYDLTAPLARHVAENFNEIQLPYRTYRAGYVFRNEKPGPGRFRQFMQFDADSVGAPGVAADAEMCMMMADTLEALGIKRGDYVIRVNNRKVLDGLMEAIGLGGEENAARRLNVLRAMDKADKFPLREIRKLLTTGRWDGGEEGKGDFTKGAGLSDEATNAILKLLGTFDDQFADILGDMQDIQFKDLFGSAFSINSTFKTGADELYQIYKIVSLSGYEYNRIKIDPSVVRGLEYYTGPVYEAELTFDVTNEKGEKVVFGSVGGGGRYDGLVSRFMGQPVPATGFSIGVSRLMTALKNLGKLGTNESTAPILVTVMDGEHLSDYMRLTKLLRDGLNPVDENNRPIGPTIPVEMYQGNWKKFGNQLKYADRRGSPIAIIQGGDERAQGVVQIKDLIEGKRLSGEITDNTEWREARVAQEVVPEAELVAKVKEILAAQAEDRARAKS
ncbi:histidyl-tRNA synthetase [Agrobacterium vitis]|nr:histidyl-tRNA synthetase [Agrobacterium vitis]MBE1436721.1 histidyl-tRNA synthetase [Agrobacterium vitis]